MHPLSSSSKTIAIIGGGPSGLVSAKEAIACGLLPTIFEKGSDFGGIWNPNTGKTWDTMRINNSYYSMSFSDHEWPEGSEDFPNQKAVYDYLCSYAKAFEIRKHALFNAHVTGIERIFSQWRIEWIDAKSKKNLSIFDSVIVCSGIFSNPFIPDIPGLQTFKGTFSHSQDYKKPDSFENQRVAVIGNAFSGSEIAAEISTKASVVFHLFRSANWLYSRYLKSEDDRRTPFDLTTTRAGFEKRKGLSSSQLNERHHRIYSVHCKKPIEICSDLTVLRAPDAPQYVAIVSDLYISQIQKKQIQTKVSPIEQIKQNIIHLSDGRQVEVDHIVFATGYRLDLPFFNEDMKQRLDLHVADPLQPLPLYKSALHPDFPNMAFVGVARFPIFFTIIELQARWTALILSNQLPSPSEETMRKGIENEKNLRKEPQPPQFLPLNLGYYEDLAQEIGALPDFERLKMDDPDLYEKLWNGPFTAAGYRLVGPGQNRAAALKKIDDINRRAEKNFENPECSYASINF